MLFDWTPTLGSYTVTINVTISGVTEEFYIDNERSSFVVAGPEITVSNLNVPEYSFINSVNDVSATVRNLGAASESVTCYLVVDGVDTDSQVINLNSGQGSVVTFSWTSTSDGTYPVGLRAEIASTEPFIDNNIAVEDVIVYDDIIDQEQDQGGFEFIIYGDRWAAQSFIPDGDSLSRLEVLLRKQGSPSSGVTVSIRSSISGVDIDSVTIPSGSIPSTADWVIVPVSSIALTPGNSYSVVMSSSGGSASSCYKWSFGYGTPYSDGDLYFL